MRTEIHPLKARRQTRQSRRLKSEDYRALGAFRHALREFLAFSRAGAEAQGLTPQQHQALLAIRTHIGEEAMTIGDLADSLLIRSHSAVGLVARLVDRGLVVRTPSELDGRRVLLALTPDAHQRLETISRNNLAELNRASGIMRDLLGALKRLDADRIWDDPPRS